MDCAISKGHGHELCKTYQTDVGFPQQPSKQQSHEELNTHAEQTGAKYQQLNQVYVAGGGVVSLTAWLRRKPPRPVKRTPIKRQRGGKALQASPGAVANDTKAVFGTVHNASTQ